MKYAKIIILTISIYFSNESFGQSIRLNEDSKKLGMDVFLMPGVNPQGERLFQFSFIKFKRLNDEIRSNSIYLITSSGRTINLTRPIKDTSYQTTKYAKGWYSSFILSPDQIAVLKAEQISDLVIIVNGKSKTLNILPPKGLEVYSLVTKYF